MSQPGEVSEDPAALRRPAAGERRLVDAWRSSVAAGSLGAREPRVGEVAVRVLTAAELDAMTPAEREAAFEASIIRDLADVPAEYQHVVDELRRRVLEREAAARQAS